MSQVINSCLVGLNNIGRVFWGYAAGMFVQAGVLIVLLLIIDSLLRKRLLASLRYCLWMLIFVKLVLPPTLSLPTGVGYWCGEYVSSSSPVLRDISDVVQPRAVGTTAPQDLATSTEISESEPFQKFPKTAGPATSAASSMPALRWQGLVFLTWLAGVLLLLALLIKRIFFVRRLIAQSLPAEGHLFDILKQCQRQLGIRGNVELRLSNNMPGPAVCGLFRPTILMPSALSEKLTSDKLRTVLIDELAHIKRGDLWVNSVQTFLQVVYFYNPFVWLANVVVRRIREQAVDEMVLVALGSEAKSYSNTLIDIAEMSFWRANLSLRLVGVVESKKALQRRIKHMLTRPIPKSAKVGVVGLLAVVILGCVLLPMAQAQNKSTDSDSKAKDSLRVYEVNKKVSEFPEEEYLSTPEAAYAAINRVMASGEQAAWRRISVKSLAGRLPPVDAKKEQVSPENAKMWLDARILEVRVFKERRAVVLAELSKDPSSPKIDKRFVHLEDGRWLNAGQDHPAGSLEGARAETNGKFAAMFEKPIRPRIDNPDTYLKPLVQFLKDKAEDPKEFVTKALARYKLVIMGEVHHRPRYWEFNSSLVTEPDFPKYVGTIYMELPSNGQELVDKFLAAEDCNTVPVIEMLRDMLWMGWPDQPMLDFFKTVWQVNQELEPQQRLRIVLVDMQRPWTKITKRQDWAQYERVDRDRQMADNVLRDIRQHPKGYRKKPQLIRVVMTI